MTRILADLPEEDIRWLDARAAGQGKSRAAVLRDAVQAYRQAAEQQGIERFFGIWADREVKP
jgi:metal-responsive CopG/Arc/MetJ family transcriptional regulator